MDRVFLPRCQTSVANAGVAHSVLPKVPRSCAVFVRGLPPAQGLRYNAAVDRDKTTSSEPGITSGRWGRIAVGSAIAAATVLFVLCASLLFYRYLTVHEPQSGIRVQGNSSLDEAIVTVQLKRGTRAWETRLQHSARYAARFFLDPGSYDVLVTTAEGDVIYHDEVELYAGEPEVIDLARLRPQTQPSL